jgi:N-acyl homoserine lactone hydrolase
VTAIHRIDYGYFVRPASETGTGAPRVEPVLGYALRHERGLLLFDTGMGSEPETDEHYRPRLRPVADALAAAGLRLDDVSFVANCHLHFDHCGGNPALAGRPVFTQRTEWQAATTKTDYTMPWLVDVPGIRYELLDGETEILPGVYLIPTPGHTDGHQSMVVRAPDGTVVVAGQSHDTATAYAADALARHAARDGHGEPLPVPPEWIDRLLAFDPSRVYFAHDHSVWIP